MNEIVGYLADDLKNGCNKKSEIKTLCDSQGKDIKLNSVNGSALLLAISTAESSCGLDNVPRFELGFSRSSILYKKSELLKEGFKLYGDCCAMSYGPWQIMWAVAVEQGYPVSLHPVNLWNGNVSLPYVVSYINKLILKGAVTVQQIAWGYNGGPGAVSKPSAQVTKYGTKVLNQYNALIGG